jgi:hypothetical protein
VLGERKPPSPKPRQAGPPVEQVDLSEGWSHVGRRGRVARTVVIPPSHTPASKRVTESRETNVTTTAKEAKPTKAEPKSTAPNKKATVKPKKAATAGSKPAAAAKPVVISKTITDLVATLPSDACEELTCRLLASYSSLPTGAARHTAVLKTVILFLTEHGSTP